MTPVPLPRAISELLDNATWTRDEGGEAGADVYRIDRTDGTALYLKYGTGDVADAITDELARLRWLAGRVAVPRLVHFARDADAAWLLSSAMTGASIDAIVAEHPERIADLAAAAGTFLRELHALPTHDCPCDAGATLRLHHARQRLDAGTVDTDDFADDHHGWTAQDVWDDMTALLPLPFDRVLTHGDYSLGNIFVADGRVIGVIDVGRAGLADGYQDIAILWENLADHAPAARRAFLAAYGIEAPDEARLRFHRCLDEFF